jgi:plasmid stabilization system protein ParE
MDYQVVFSRQADRDLEAIVRFLAQKNPSAAERLGHSLIDTALSLATLPRRGAPVRGRAGWRRILHRPWFVIFFRVDDAQRQVEVARFWDARQDPELLKLD